MFYASYKDPYGVINNNLYYRNQDYFEDTFSPNCEQLEIINFQITGKTYKERKASAEQLAIDFSYADTSGMSYGELNEIAWFFEKVGKRYGLLKDFRENAIC